MTAAGLGRVALFALMMAAIGCGGAARRSADLRAQLAAEESRTVRERAPDLIASVESALDAADLAEGGGDLAAASDRVTQARLLLDAARAESARIEDEAARREIEERIAEVLARARRDEAAREAIGRELALAAAARTAHEEARRALTEAEADEGRHPRRGRVSLEEGRDLARGAAALRDRAELLLAAAGALGADAAARAPAAALVTASRAERDPREALRSADRAAHEALRALGVARGATEAPAPDTARALAEAAGADGFEVLSLEHGIAVEAEGLFAGDGTSLSSAGRARVARLATLAAAHPVGPVHVEVATRRAGAAGDRLAERRADVVLRALGAAGVAPARLVARGLPSSLHGETPRDAVRLVFLAYAP